MLKLVDNNNPPKTSPLVRDLSEQNHHRTLLDRYYQSHRIRGHSPGTVDNYKRILEGWFNQFGNGDQPLFTWNSQKGTSVPCLAETYKFAENHTCNGLNCSWGEIAFDHKCISLNCSDDEYVFDKRCTKLECEENEYIADHTCVRLDCDEIETAKNHTCIPLNCSFDQKAINYRCADLDCWFFQDIIDHGCVTNRNKIIFSLFELIAFMLAVLLGHQFYRKYRERHRFDVSK